MVSVMTVGLPAVSGFGSLVVKRALPAASRKGPSGVLATPTPMLRTFGALVAIVEK